MKKTNIDSPFYRTMGKIGDLLFVNLLWLVCCLPIVTAGASTLGLFTVVNKMAAKEDYTVHTDFFKAFKRDFKQSTALWLVLLLAGFAALTGLRTATAQDTPSTGILAAASFLLLMLAGCCGSWGFALLARFTYPGVLPVLRAKGFVQDENGGVKLNATADGLTANAIPKGQEVLIVIGEGLEKERIEVRLKG